MKIKLLLIFSVCFATLANAQCNVPPPPGLSGIYGLDTDNDGYAVFDIQYYIDNIDRPLQESIYGVSSIGYNFVFRDVDGNPAPLMYNSMQTTGFRYAAIIQEYTGSGPTFDPLPPCYWPIIGASALFFYVLPYDQDRDGDGISNADEDTNRNGNLMDDDDDSDHIVNVIDNLDNRLGIKEQSNLQLSLYPNPVTNGSFTFESNVSVLAVTIYDLTGKQLYDSKINSNTVNVDTIAAGIYLLKFQSDKGSIYKKIAIH